MQPSVAAAPATPAGPGPAGGRDARQSRALGFGIAAVVLGWLAMNLLFGAAEKETVDHPPNQPELAIGTALLAPTAAGLALAFPVRGAPRVLAWVALGLLALGVLWAAGLWMDPAR